MPFESEQQQLPNVFSGHSIGGNALVVKNTFIDLDEDLVVEDPLLRRRRSTSMPALTPGSLDEEFADCMVQRPIFLEVDEERFPPNQSGQILEVSTKNIKEFLTAAFKDAGATLKDCDAQSDASTDTGKGRMSDTRSTTSGSETPISIEDVEIEKTTVMLRNLPEAFTREALVQLLNREGFCGRYDYVYLPMHFSLRTTFGYAFINLVSTENAEIFRDHFEGFNRWPEQYESSKVASVGWSDALQGCQAQVDRYRDSRIMHESMPDELKPALFNENGVRLPFPPPTKPLRAPRARPAQKKAAIVGQHTV